MPHERKREAYARLCERAARGEIKVDVERVPLTEVADAFERQMRSPARSPAEGATFGGTFGGTSLRRRNDA